MMDYSLDDNIPPPLDDISSAGGTEGDLEDYDLDSANLNPYANASAAQKQYKSFQPSIKLKPTDLVYREEHSRAAPRKGIEPKAFLAIGETKPETAEYVGRPQQPVTAPVQNQSRQAVSASTRKYTQYNQRHTAVHSAPANNRNKSRISRGTSGKGRNSAWSSAAFTPLPVAPPPVLPVKENTYVLHPFKQDSSHDQRHDPYLPTNPQQHRLSTMEEFQATLQTAPSRCSSASELRRPMPPGEDLKQATILATMEVGRFINQREKTPKVTKCRQPKLLKARLRPLNTVNVKGPNIQQCQGIQSDDRKLGPSPMKAKQQKKLDDIIKKNAAIKDMPSANYASSLTCEAGYGSSKASTAADSKRRSSRNSENTLTATEHKQTLGREPTPSPYTSMTQLDKICKDTQGGDAGDKDPTQSGEARPVSATESEATHTEQETIARSVSAVTIRQKSSASQYHPAQSAADGGSVGNANDGLKGTIFITNANSEIHSSTSTKQPQKKPPHTNKDNGGCRDFMETNTSDRDDDNSDDKHKKDNQLASYIHLSSHVAVNNSTSDPPHQPATQSSHNVKQNNATLQTEVEVDLPKEYNQQNSANMSSSSTPVQETSLKAPNNEPEVQPAASRLSSSFTERRKNSLSSKSKGQLHNSKCNENMDSYNTFITAGFLTLESMINEARNTLRHSYSLNDLDKSCEWEEPISSPRSIEVLNKGVTFSKYIEEHHYYHPQLERTEADELQLMLHGDNQNETGSTQLSKDQSLSNNNQPDIQDRQLVGLSNVEDKDKDIDCQQKESASRYSVYGIHGQISEYLTTKTLVRQVYPHPVSKPTKSTVSDNPTALDTETHVSEPSSPTGNGQSELAPGNPPPTPAFSFPLELFSSYDESFTPELNSPISELESPNSEGKCFLETIVDLIPESVETVEAPEQHSTIRGPLSAVVEGVTKPVNSRQNNEGVVEPIATAPPSCFRITALPPSDHIFYFAYDADMMQNRFSTLLGRKIEDKRWALLFGFQLVFNKTGMDKEAGLFANIEANAYSSTEGALYTITYEELAIVDGLHGYPHHYARLLLPVWVCNSSDPDNYNIAQYCVPAVTYIAQDEWTCNEESSTASRDYSLRQCVNGSDQLTTAFKEHLNSLLADCSA